MSFESTFRDGTGINLPDYQLIETFRFEPDVGFIRLERHLKRLETSARELGFSFQREKLNSMLAARAMSVKPLRIRISLDPLGNIDLEAVPYEPVDHSSVWRLAIAKTRLDHKDDLLSHKTTKREKYNAAREEYSRSEIDEVLLCNDRDEVCEGTITTIFADFGDGIYHTPALSCGLLNGVLRAELLETGQAKESVLKFDDLLQAQQLWVGNSLRGLIKARLIL